MPTMKTAPQNRRVKSARENKSNVILALPAALFLTGLLIYSDQYSSPVQEYLLAGGAVLVSALLFGLSGNYLTCAISQAMAVIFSLSYHAFAALGENLPLGRMITFQDALHIGIVWFFGFLVTVLIRLFSSGRWDTRKKRAGFRYAFHLSSIVFLAAYAALLVWLFGTLRTMDLDGERSLNLIPLKGAFAIYWPHILKGEFRYGIFIQFFGNLFIFTPLGFYLCVYAKRMPKGILILLPMFLSGAIETTQYIFNMGKSDIDDFWMNVLGFWIGILLYRLVGLVRRLVTRGAEKNIC